MPHEVLVRAAAFQQLAMRPTLHDSSLVYDAYPTRVLNRAQAVRHDDDGVVRHHASESFLNDRLALRVQRARGFVQEKHGRVPHERARDRDALLLPPRQRRPALADDFFVSPRQRGDELVRVRRLRRGDDLLRARLVVGVGVVVVARERDVPAVGFGFGFGFAAAARAASARALLLLRALEAEDDVPPQRPVKQRRLLRHQRYPPFQPPRVQVREVAAVQTNDAAVRDVKPLDQVDHGRLPAAGRSDERDCLPGVHREVEVRQHATIRSRRVREAHHLQREPPDAPLRDQPRARDLLSVISVISRREPSSGSGSGSRPRVKLWPLRDELQHLLRRPERDGDGGEHVRDGREATRELLLVQHERHERAGV
eukprot:30041-Pelagococcus_subviridis.AAC.11